jgi:hypothetical protein
MGAENMPSYSDGVVTEMYKVLTVVCVIAIIALGTSVISAVIQNSTTARQSKQISSLSTNVAKYRHEVAVLRGDLRHQRAHAHTQHTRGPHSLRRPAGHRGHVIKISAHPST